MPETVSLRPKRVSKHRSRCRRARKAPGWNVSSTQQPANRSRPFVETAIQVARGAAEWIHFRRLARWRRSRDLMKIKDRFRNVVRGFIYGVPSARRVVAGLLGSVFKTSNDSPEFWDQALSTWAKPYLGGTFTVDSRYALTLTLLHHFCPRAKSLLDMGCAGGTLAQFLDSSRPPGASSRIRPGDGRTAASGVGQNGASAAGRRSGGRLDGVRARPVARARLRTLRARPAHSPQRHRLHRPARRPCASRPALAYSTVADRKRVAPAKGTRVVRTLSGTSTEAAVCHVTRLVEVLTRCAGRSRPGARPWPSFPA